MSSFRTEELFRVQGKVVLVTGGSRGIGKMIATGFVSNGCKVYITSRTQKECSATAEELSRTGPGQCIGLPANLQEYDEVKRLVSDLESREKGTFDNILLLYWTLHRKALHVLVNNAGATWGEDLEKYPDTAFTKVMTLNVQRIFTLTQLCLPILREAALQGGKEGDVFKDPARIINIGSVDGEKVPLLETYAYSASKAAVHHLNRHLAGRLGFEGITSNTLACGPFESKMMAHTLKTAGETIKASNPLQRIGRPEDVAGAALFLASKAGSYINGATIAIDGGSLVTMHPRLGAKL